MNLFKIVANNMRHRALATALTTLSVTLGVALAVAILLIRNGMETRFQQGTLGYEMVVGAKGSPLQLVLNTVYNLDISPGNIPWKLCEQLRADRRVKLAIPFSVGDNYKGYRILGTTDALFKDFEFEPGRHFSLSSGRFFTFSEADLTEAFHEALQRSKDREARESGQAAAPGVLQEERERHAEAVIGATVAQTTGLKVGDTFIAAHGVIASPNAEEHTENPWTVVGILEPTYTANDRALFINLDSFYHIEGHEIRESKVLPKEEEKDGDPDPGQVSSLVLKLKSPIHALPLYREINDSDNAMAAFPGVEIHKLFAIIGNIDRILLAQAVLIVMVAGIAIAVSIYNSMSERRREIAILRALGARRQNVFAIVLLESVAICFTGALAGLAAGHFIVFLGNPMLLRASGFTVPASNVSPIEIGVIAGCVLLGAVSGLGPAARAYRTDVAGNLAPSS